MLIFIWIFVILFCLFELEYLLYYDGIVVIGVFFLILKLLFVSEIIDWKILFFDIDNVLE